VTRNDADSSYSFTRSPRYRPDDHTTAHTRDSTQGTIPTPFRPLPMGSSAGDEPAGKRSAPA